MKLDNFEKVLAEYCDRIVSDYKNALISSGKNKGQLYNTFKCSYKITSSSILVYYEAPDYFKYVEEGRRPGKFPPVFAIKEFIAKRNILPRDNISEDSLAFLIGRKIAREGIEPTHYLEKIMQKIAREYEMKFKKAMEMDMKAEAVQNINKSLKKILNGISN